MPNSELDKTLSKLSSISRCAKGNSTFEFLSLAHLLNVEYLGFANECREPCNETKKKIL